MNSFYRPRCLLYISSFQPNFFECYQNILHLLYRTLVYFEALHALYIWAPHGCFREIRLGQILQNRFSSLEGLVTAKCVLCQEGNASRRADALSTKCQPLYVLCIWDTDLVLVIQGELPLAYPGARSEPKASIAGCCSVGRGSDDVAMQSLKSFCLRIHWFALMLYEHARGHGDHRHACEYALPHCHSSAQPRTRRQTQRSQSPSM